MYKLLIVDDEPLAVIGIRSMIESLDLDLQVTDTVGNGEEALTIMKKDMPDIVLTDIKMPVMDGLTYIKTCRELYGEKKPVFIMLTSYEEFWMAKKAITYNAMEYLVKVELTEDILKKTLLKAIEKIGPMNEKNDDAVISESSFIYRMRDKFMISLLHDLFESEEQFRLQAQDLGLSFDHEQYMCCYGELLSPQHSSLSYAQHTALFAGCVRMISNLVERSCPCHMITLDNSHFAMIICSAGSLSDPSEFFDRVFNSVHNYYNVTIKCGIGITVTSPMSICDSFQFARSAFRRCSDETPVVLSPDKGNPQSHDSFNISLVKTDLIRAFEDYDPALLSDTVSRLSNLLNEHQEHYVQALDLASNLLYLSISILPDGEDVLNDHFKDTPDSYLSLYRMNSVSQIIDWLDRYRECMHNLFEERRRDHKNHIVSDVKKYISSHTHDKLSLNEVAATFGISPSYLSQLFSRYNDTGFNEYINICKIEEAKRLLKSENLKVYEVADTLNFGSEFYFSKVFKKIQGVTPSEYIAKP
ncbi:MAG: AraC family transcriptional regulator [Lachnospiraceae bacterium]|nr:AraC family transcriptional regulator [Lachnospiraceae bacterium]